jgi:hypothetical protein
MRDRIPPYAHVSLDEIEEKAKTLRIDLYDRFLAARNVMDLCADKKFEQVCAATTYAFTYPHYASNFNFSFNGSRKYMIYQAIQSTKDTKEDIYPHMYPKKELPDLDNLKNNLSGITAAWVLLYAGNKNQASYQHAIGIVPMRVDGDEFCVWDTSGEFAPLISFEPLRAADIHSRALELVQGEEPNQFIDVVSFKRWNPERLMLMEERQKMRNQS